MNWWAAGVAGVGVAALTSFAFGRAKRAQVQRAGEAVALSLRSSGGAAEVWLARQGAEAQARIAAMARTETERLARQAADQYLAQVYGLTPTRIAQLQSLAARWS